MQSLIRQVMMLHLMTFYAVTCKIYSYILHILYVPVSPTYQNEVKVMELLFNKYKCIGIFMKSLI